MTLNGTVYAKGLGVHAASDIRYTMSSCTSFTASVGVDDEVVSTAARSSSRSGSTASSPTTRGP